ncbi:endothelial differentiation-related factor 1-like protein [Vairimorpha necatrix]|uniref:Endothelial differentiation-related factor 1-like protein n=1 Tax=Vairimorpha necatrix TaxID=6039 RepID=A0AAX4JCU7_9MICR
MNYDKPIIIRKNKPAPKSSLVTLDDDVTLKLVPKDIQDKIKEARVRLEMDQKDLAKKMDKKVSVVKEWEKGTANYDKNLAKAFEKALNIKLHPK